MNTKLIDELRVLEDNLSLTGVRVEEIEKARIALERMNLLACMLEGSRSDISDILFGIMDGKDFAKDDIEHRHIRAKLYIYRDDLDESGKCEIELEYDTLTTLISYHIDGTTDENGYDDWKEAPEHEYVDNGGTA